MSKLTEKASGINFADLDVKPTPQNEAGRPRTAIGAISASLALGRGVEEENRQIKAKLAELENTPVVMQIDPKEIGRSRFANRHELSFASEEFAALKAEIQSSGGNVQPIKVRRAGPSSVSGVRYEIVFGHRRHRACLELGLPVACIVEDLSDLALFSEMERENRDRASLSAWEQGRMYCTALDEGLFPSLRQLATALNVDIATISRAIAIAQLPDEVIGSFQSPLDIQLRWAAALKDAVESNRKRVIAVCNEIASMPKRPKANEIIAKIVGAGDSKAPASKRAFTLNDKDVATLERGFRGEIAVKIKAGVFTDADQKQLADLIEDILAKKL
jgi:ParB family chromosome partitioning protein